MTRARPNLSFVMFVVMLVLAALDQTILSTALPAIAHDLDGHARISWVFSAYLIASTVVILLYGKLADIHGSRPVLLAAIGLFLSGSLGCGLSQTMDQLIVARAVQGAGGGGLMTLTMLGVADLFPAQQRGRYQALLGGSYAVAMMFGPLLGGVVVQHLSWHWAFFINLPIALLALMVLVIVFRPQSVRHAQSVAQSVDYPGAALLAATLITVLVATRRDAGFGTWIILMLAICAALFAVAFLWTERRARHALLPLSLFANRAFAGATVISVISGVALFAAVVFLPLYLQTGLGKTPTTSALYLLPLMGGLTLAAIAGGKVLRADGPIRVMALVASGLMAASFAALAVSFRFLAAEPMALSACLLPLGLSIGLLLPVVTVVSQRVSSPQQMGIATATPIMVRSLGGALGVSILASLLARGIAAHLANHPGASFNVGFSAAVQPVYWSVAAVSLVALFAARGLPQRLSSRSIPASNSVSPMHASAPIAQ